MLLSARARALLSVGRTAPQPGPLAVAATVFRRSMFIQTEPTPNPDSLKFLPGKPVLDVGQTRDYRSFREAQASPLAKALFQTEGVAGVFLSADFITISKSDEAEWLTLKPQVDRHAPLLTRLLRPPLVCCQPLRPPNPIISRLHPVDLPILLPHSPLLGQLFASIMDFYAGGEDALHGDSEEPDSLLVNDDDSEVVQMIKELLDMRIRPSVQEDGGDIKFHQFDEESGVVSLEMQGSCSGCPSSSVTLKSGIENMLMHYIPEVKEVENIAEAGFEDEGVLA